MMLAFSAGSGISAHMRSEGIDRESTTRAVNGARVPEHAHTCKILAAGRPYATNGKHKSSAVTKL